MKEHKDSRPYYDTAVNNAHPRARAAPAFSACARIVAPAKAAKAPVWAACFATTAHIHRYVLLCAWITFKSLTFGRHGQSDTPRTY